MKGRPLYWLPDRFVEFLSECPGMRQIWSEAWLELHARANDAAEAASDEQRGPWLVKLPPGMH